jgi:hypothetical protein
MNTIGNNFYCDCYVLVVAMTVGHTGIFISITNLISQSAFISLVVVQSCQRLLMETKE